MHRRLGLVAALITLGALAGCSDDDPVTGPSAPTSSASDESSASSAPSVPSGSTESSSAAEPEPTGPELTLDGASLRLPDTYGGVQETDFLLTAEDSETGTLVSLGAVPSLGGTSAEQLLASSAKNTLFASKPAEADPVTVGDEELFHLTGPYGGPFPGGGDAQFDLYGAALASGVNVTVYVASAQELGEEERAAIIDPILAGLDLG